MNEPVSILALCADVISYARCQDGMKAVSRIVITNTSDDLLTGLVLSIETDPEVIPAKVIHIGDIKAKGKVTLDDVRTDLSVQYLADLTEMQNGNIRITVSGSKGGIPPVAVSYPVTILPYDQWEGMRKAGELLASYCVPNHPAVKNLIVSASEKMRAWTGNGTMDAYDSGQADRVKKQAAAIFDAIKEKGITYALPPAGFYESGQRIRMPEEIVSTGQATCIDTAMLFASCLESVGLRPLVILNRTHAYTGFWLDGEATSPCVLNDDLALLRKRNAEGINQMLPIETTFVDKSRKCTFDDAVKEAERTLADAESFECWLDIHEARKLGKYPLPLRVRTATGYEIRPTEPVPGSTLPSRLPSSDEIDISAPRIVDKQIIWERKLLDLTLRNNLINIHPRSILQLMDPDAQSLVSSVENGRSMRICPCPKGWSGERLNGIFATVPRADRMAPFADAEVMDGKLHCYLEEDKTEARTDTLRKASRRSVEENGANTLYLTVGTLKWTENDRGHVHAHYAPIILIPCEIIRQSGSITASGEEPAVNLTLLEMLRENFGITIPGLDVLPQKDGHIDVRRTLNTVRKAVMDRKGWEVDPLVFLGNFTFSKFIIWNDIHSAREVFDCHPIISSLKSGSLDGRIERLQTEEDIDAACPADRVLLPLTADSSQMKAIRDALDGKSFVMQGPPGTGKSQTITNIIANAIYRGKKVLFVSEKKAALEVVQKRLESIGLGPMCLELHSNKAKKSIVLSKLQATLESDGRPYDSSTFNSEAQTVSDLRSKMDSHTSSLHVPDSSGISLYDAVSHYLSSSDDVPCRNMPNSVMSSLSPESVRRMQAVTKDYALAAGHVDMEAIRGLLDLPVTQYTPRLAANLNKEMERLMGTGNPLLFRWRSRVLPRMVGCDLWKGLGLKDNASRRKKIKDWYGAMDNIRDYAIYNSRRAAMRSLGLGLLASDYEKGGIKPAAMQDFLMKSIHRTLAKNLISENSGLSMFSGDLFSNTVSDYREAEDSYRQACREEICRKLHEGIRSVRTAADNQELAVLKKAISNGARGISLRNLFSKIPVTLPKLCPCLLMSPLSVSQYLGAGTDLFDIVIFDEASQMQTCEAVGAIGRGRSLIVTGDSKQLPPTTFFETLTFDDDNAEQEDLESVLEDCLSISLPSNMLRWHYRSRHESLIAFSNSKYYDNSLLTFPSADDLTDRVTLTRVKGIYERGGSRQNKKEAEAVVAEIRRRLEENPERSIGVITFSEPQQTAVEKRLETMLRANPGLAAVAAQMEEPIFVKNLENVQGDERDVILFSIGYGKDRNGRLPMNFGPLNRKGGWRRLNVAVSRARYEMKVFSSIAPEDIRVDYNTEKGVIGLRDFIRYAEEGRACLEDRTDSSAERDVWVEKIADELRSRGLQVNTNVGTSDFRVDIAVLDPERKGHYSCGIICDGLNYAGAKSAIDREKIRPEMLESLGWKIERRWILDDWHKQ